ncbi:hypothetical protein VL20_3795 [Microcystis panniformis FACHB-1757]|uniref:Uncharacterized protein n=1 Tax=Microcystis panniformis FACHB-1757 TaxID=1638788 RepID=A0A0K1S468_9CHRO|nr:hypothetical protein VL20_3795 [Microcystis panniformis FACHB-1757]
MGSDRYRCRVRSLMWLLLLHRSILGERTMHIDGGSGLKCDAALVG